jgi:hypothetical protein
MTIFDYIQGRMPEVGDWIKSEKWAQFWEVEKLTSSGQGIFYMDLRNENRTRGGANWTPEKMFAWKYSEPKEPVCDIPDYLYDRDEDV